MNKKKGFSVPIKYWMKFNLKNWCKDILLDPYTMNLFPDFKNDYLWKQFEDYGKADRVIWNMILYSNWRLNKQ